MMQNESETNTLALAPSMLKAAQAFGVAHGIELRAISDSELANMLGKILFGPKDVLKALSVHIITLEEARNRILFEVELWLRERQSVPHLAVDDWVPPGVSVAIDGWLADWLQKQAPPPPP